MGAQPVSVLDFQAYLNVYKAAITQKRQYFINQFLSKEFYEKAASAEQLQYSERAKIKQDVKFRRNEQLCSTLLVKIPDLYAQAKDIINDQAHLPLDTFKALSMIQHSIDAFCVEPKQLGQFLSGLRYPQFDEDVAALMRPDVTDNDVNDALRPYRMKACAPDLADTVNSGPGSVEIVDELGPPGSEYADEFITGQSAYGR